MTHKTQGFEHQHPLVRVEWEDSTGIPRWRDLEDAKRGEPLMITTAGFLIRDDDTCIVVAASYDHQIEPNVDLGVAIPRSAVRKVERIRSRRKGGKDAA